MKNGAFRWKPIGRASTPVCSGRKAFLSGIFILSDDDTIIGGVGAIQNDFHKRTDLTPNLCAVYVEESCRGCGAARALLEFACDDLAAIGIENVYLLTDHVGFYERCGWSFLCMAEENGGGWARVYHRALARPEPVTDGR